MGRRRVTLLPPRPSHLPAAITTAGSSLLLLLFCHTVHSATCRVCVRCRAERFIDCLVSGGVSHSACAWLTPRASRPCSGMLAVPDLHDLHSGSNYLTGPLALLVTAVSGALSTRYSLCRTTLAAGRSAALQSLGLVCLLSGETRNRPPGCGQRWPSRRPPGEADVAPRRGGGGRG